MSNQPEPPPWMLPETPWVPPESLSGPPSPEGIKALAMVMHALLVAVQLLEEVLRWSPQELAALQERPKLQERLNELSKVIEELKAQKAMIKALVGAE